MTGYHFTTDQLRDGRPLPAIGEWLEHEGDIVPCISGLHASEHPFDALLFAPGPMLHCVELEGDLISHGEKCGGRRRKILATVDATELLREFIRWCALQVIDLWDAPDVVRRYLETGDESLRHAARDAAWAAWDAREASWAARDAAGGDAAGGSLRASWAARAAREKQATKFAEMVDEAFGLNRCG